MAIAKALRLNERIRISPVRVIDQNDVQLGVMPTAQALQLAHDAGLDLVEVSPNETPPVCRILDYGKAQFEKKKRQKTAAASHTITVKEIRLRPKTDPHDRMIKMKKARNFLFHGDKVQFTMLFRGRERAHREIGFDTFNQILKELGDTVRVERMPLVDGRRMTMVVAPVKRTPPKATSQQRTEAPDRPTAQSSSNGDASPSSPQRTGGIEG